MNTQYLATVVLLLGVAMAWVGVRQTVTGHGLVVGSLYVILTFFLYFQFMSPFHHLVGDGPSVWVPVIYSFTFGLAYTMAGFILFDRFTEI